MPETALNFDDSLSLALARGEKRTYLGVDINVRFLDISDLIALQREFPSMSGGFSFDANDLSQVRYFLYLVLRKSDARLTEREIIDEAWKLTERQVGRLLTMPVLSSQETKDLISYVMVGSGLAETPAEASASKNVRPAKARS